MKLTLTYLLTILAIGNALPHAADSQRDGLATIESRDFSPLDSHDLFKRKGGGGSGSRGGSGSSGSGSSSSRGGSSSSSGSSSSRPAGSSTSSTGGSTKGGSGVTPNYGGTYYAGGARTPYTSGTRSPSGISPVLLPVAALAIFPGLWLYGAYAYNYPHPYTFHNSTSNTNETKPIECLCAEYQVCGCDGNTNTTYFDDLIGNGSVADLDSAVKVATVNGTSTLVVNGTLANGTTADDGTASGAARMMMELSGFWVMALTVVAMVVVV